MAGAWLLPMTKGAIMLGRTATALRSNGMRFSLGGLTENAPMSKVHEPKHFVQLGKYKIDVSGNVYDTEKRRHVIGIMSSGEKVELVYRLWVDGECIVKTRDEWKKYYKDNGGEKRDAFSVARSVRTAQAKERRRLKAEGLING
jgi:long-subunit acyl-CoA synthetase (AMP-forming)